MKVTLEDNMIGEIKPILKPCPFCRNKRVSIAVDNAAYSLGFSEDTNFQVVCSITAFGCGASSGWYKTKEEAIEAWNRRETNNNEN